MNRKLLVAAGVGFLLAGGYWVAVNINLTAPTVVSKQQNIVCYSGGKEILRENNVTEVYFFNPNVHFEVGNKIIKTTADCIVNSE